MKRRKATTKFLIGIDEAGRGPLAGPVAVGVFVVRIDGMREALKMFPGARDSKKMTPVARAAVFLAIKNAWKAGHVNFAVGFSSASFIDRRGIVSAIKSAMEKALRKVEKGFPGGPTSGDACTVLLDGSLKAPIRYKNQTTIIRGDDSEPVISLASICAKVLRDQTMTRLAKKYPRYSFDVHKGYGTKSHYAAIKKHGFCAEHRRSFLKGVKD
jgi:ribonuclease HII